MDKNRSYYMRRAAQERSAVQRSTGKAREAHQRMAAEYEERARDQSPAAESVSA